MSNRLATADWCHRIHRPALSLSCYCCPGHSDRMIFSSHPAVWCLGLSKSMSASLDKALPLIQESPYCPCCTRLRHRTQGYYSWCLLLARVTLCDCLVSRSSSIHCWYCSCYCCCSSLRTTTLASLRQMSSHCLALQPLTGCFTALLSTAISFSAIHMTIAVCKLNSTEIGIITYCN